MEPLRPRLRRLGVPQAADYALACVDHAFSGLRVQFRRGVPAADLLRAEACLRSLWQHLEPGRVISPVADEDLRQLTGLIPDEQETDPVEGWSDFLFACVAAIRCINGRDLPTRCFDAVGVSYQAVARQQVYPLRQRGWTQVEFRDAERKCSVCSQELEFQLQALSLIEEGKWLGSSTFTDLP